jgi:hypothetical protein
LQSGEFGGWFTILISQPPLAASIAKMGSFAKTWVLALSCWMYMVFHLSLWGHFLLYTMYSLLLFLSAEVEGFISHSPLNLHWNKEIMLLYLTNEMYIDIVHVYKMYLLALLLLACTQSTNAHTYLSIKHIISLSIIPWPCHCR